MFRILFNQEFSQRLQVLEVSWEWNCNIINFVFKTELHDIVLIVLIDCWECDCNSGQTHIFLLAQFTFIQNMNCYNTVLFALDHGWNTSISEKNFISNVDWRVEILVRTSYSIRITQMTVISSLNHTKSYSTQVIDPFSSKSACHQPSFLF